jgi:hypothetical protein
MSEDQKPEPPRPPEPPPDPIEDVRKGLGLLFRAAKSAIESLPTGKVEDAVITGAREVGRAIENVTQTLDKQFFKRDRPADGAKPDEGAEATKTEDKKSEPPSPPPPPDEPRGPRVE